MEKHFLDLKYPDLQKPLDETGEKSVVQTAVERQEQQTGEELPNDPNERIETYLARLEKLILDPENEQGKKNLGDVLQTKRPRALSLLRQKIINEYILPNKDKMAEGATMVEERAGRQMGVNVEYTDELRERRGEIAVGDLESSLDQWITYLSDKNEPYPVWFRYYAFRNILNLGEYDKDKQEFPKRSKGTFKLFPDVDRGALAYVQEMMEASQDDEVLNRIRQSQKTLWQTPDNDLLTKDKAKAFTNLSFARQYADGIKQNGDISPELRAETRGEWVHYQQGTDPTALWLSLQNKGTAWCTKGYPTAKTQLGGGDFYVYYTLDSTGKPTIPRIAIRMEGKEKIAENPRGVFDAKQNLEPNMVEIMEAKLKEFGPEADKYKKKSADMKHLTDIEHKTNQNKELTKEDLLFLYEVNSSIEGFGYEKDPRIEEIRKQRNLKEDLPILFDCTPEQIVTSTEDLTENTVAYIGPWNPSVLQKLPKTVEHVYTKFPDGKVFLKEITTDLEINSADTAIVKLEKEGHKISDYAKDILIKVDWQEKLKSSYEVVSFSVSDLFNDKNVHNFGDIKIKAQELGLDLIPQALAPSIRLNYSKDGNWTNMALKESIRGRDGRLGLFDCGRDGSESWLSNNGGHDDNRWDDDYRFFFVRK
jgi:hypothetical protein